MKYYLIIFALLFSGLDAVASSLPHTYRQFTADGGKRKKDGSYKKKKHVLKKLIQGKRYCDCPKN